MSINSLLKAAAVAAPFGLAAACTDSQGRVDPVRTGALLVGTGVAASVLANNNDNDDRRDRDRDRGRYSWRNDQGERHSCGDGHRHVRRCGF